MRWTAWQKGVSVALLCAVACDGGGAKESEGTGGDDTGTAGTDDTGTDDTGTGGTDDTGTDDTGTAPICTAATLAGRYAFIDEGDAILTDGAAPYIAGGVVTFNADGTLAYAADESTDGAVAEYVPSGTFTVDGATCMGSAVDSAGDPLIDFTVISADEIRYIRRQSGTVITGRARRAAEGCDTTNVQGEYAYAFNAWVYLDIPGWPEGASPFAGSGIVSVADAGALTLADSASIAGIPFDRSYDGEVQIAADCTGPGYVTLPETAPTSTNPVHVEVVWAADREEAMVIQTDAGTFIGGVTTRRPDGLTCDLADLAGRYGFLTKGTVGNTDPYVSGGVAEIAADGTVTFTGTQSQNGTVGGAAPGAGTLSLGEGCRGSIVDPHGDPLFDVTVVNHGDLRMIRNDGGNVITGFARRMAENCTTAGVAGSYGYGINAVVYLDLPGFPVGASPFAGAGEVVVHADGTLALVDTASINGLILDRSYDGTVTVNSDCTGDATINLPEQAPTSTNPVHVDVFWLAEGGEAIMIQKDAGTFIAGSTIRRTILE